MATETPNDEKSEAGGRAASAVERLVKCGFLGTEDKEFRAFIEQMPDTHWAKYDLSAVRLGWEAHKVLSA